MEWAAWAPTYRAILADFGYDAKADEDARDLLDALLETRLLADERALADALRGRDVLVAGPRPTSIPDGPLLVTDAAAAWAVPRARPVAIVTDLDGDVPVQLAANALGVPLVVHAHGDNQDALRAHVPHMRGPVLGTTQAEPRGRVRDFGGFTDGDRACCLAAHFGARSLTLLGFDFEEPWPKPGRAPDAKRRKLAWARRIVDSLALPVRMAD